MRTIKFRAYVKSKGGRYPVGMHDWQSIKDSIDGECGWLKSLFSIGCDSEQDNVVLMQFTGLKDKNGIEIYEGDFLKITTKYLLYYGSNTSDQYRTENYAFYEVFFHDNDSCDSHIGFQMNRRHTIGADGESQINPRFKPSMTSQCSVIGNIYENPELLERTP